MYSYLTRFKNVTFHFLRRWGPAHHVVRLRAPTILDPPLIVNVMCSPIIEKLMVRGSQVAPKHVIHDMITIWGTTLKLVMELSRRAIKRWVPCGDMERRLKILHVSVECCFSNRIGYHVYLSKVQ